MAAPAACPGSPCQGTGAARASLRLQNFALRRHKTGRGRRRRLPAARRGCPHGGPNRPRPALHPDAGCARQRPRAGGGRAGGGVEATGNKAGSKAGSVASDGAGAAASGGGRAETREGRGGRHVGSPGPVSAWPPPTAERDIDRRNRESEVVFDVMICLTCSHHSPQVIILRGSLALRKVPCDKMGHADCTNLFCFPQDLHPL